MNILAKTFLRKILYKILIILIENDKIQLLISSFFEAKVNIVPWMGTVRNLGNLFE